MAQKAAPTLKVTIGHSPDPDDAFLFYALTRGKLTYPGFSFDECLEGIEALNQRALKGELEMTAISLHAYAYCADKYLLLTAGASVGEGYGPVLVTRKPMPVEEIVKKPIAVPGKLTTAALLIQLALGRLNLKFMPFDQILPAVVSGEVESGVVIHEGQLTYGSEGLVKIMDLGEWWFQETQMPAPLGVNAVRRNLGKESTRRLSEIFKASLDYSYANRADAIAYSKQFGRGLDTAGTDRFVGMYVNHWALDCRPEAAEAMQRLLDWSADEGLIPNRVQVEFA